MRKQNGESQAPAFDYAKSAEARQNKKAAKEAAGLKLGWTRKLAVFAWCYQCQDNQMAEVRNCKDSRCPLWPFRCRHGLTPAEWQEFEKDFSETSDGKSFLKRFAGGEDVEPLEDAAPAVLEIEW